MSHHTPKTITCFSSDSRGDSVLGRETLKSIETYVNLRVGFLLRFYSLQTQMLVDECLFNLCLFSPSFPDMNKSKPQYFVLVIYIPGICTIKSS